jgi:hypothetical protein
VERVRYLLTLAVSGAIDGASSLTTVALVTYLSLGRGYREEEGHYRKGGGERRRNKMGETTGGRKFVRRSITKRRN